MSVNVTKDKFVLVQDKDILYDEEMRTVSIGYYHDAWIRFRKNKASFVASIILVFLIFMSIIGPWFSSYTLNDDNQKWANRLDLLPPKVELLDNFNMFSGEKVLENYPAYFDQFPEELFVSGVLNEPNAIGQIKMRVDFYAFTDYRLSYMTNTSLSIAEYEIVRAHDDALLFDDDPSNDDQILLINDAPLVNGAYKVNIHFFAFLDVVYGIDEVAFVFGSDIQGQDLFTQLWKGARLSLMIAVGVSIINIIVGLVIGSISGYYGGIIDLIIQRTSEILGGLPFLAIITLLLLRYGNEIWVVVLAFTMTGWLGISSLTRSQFYRYKSREYVLVARTLGAGDIRIMSRHIFPSAVGTLITSLVLYIPGVIFTESTFSFLGIINYGEKSSIGRLLSTGQSVMKENFYMVLFPAIFISLLMLSFNLFGNGLRDAFNPSLRGVEE